MELDNPFHRQLWYEIMNRGGLHNAHLHLGRVNTFQNFKDAHVSLDEKHSLIKSIYNDFPVSLSQGRIERSIDKMISCGTVKADTCVDIFDEIGLDSFNQFVKIKNKYKRFLNLDIGAYCPFEIEGVNKELIDQAAPMANFICATPEKEHFDSDIENVLALSYRYKINPSFHLDQENTPLEFGTWRLCEIMKANGVHGATAIHVISPSCYQDEKFFNLVDKMLDRDVSVIVCPTAAISMRQIRDKLSPIHNSIPRVWDFVSAGVKVKIGSDNAGDILCPATSVDLFAEAIQLANATRCYDPVALARISTMGD